MRKLFSILLVLFNILFLFAQAEVSPSKRYIKTWRVSEQFAKVDSLVIDTISLNFQDHNPIENLSIANSYNGNLGSPIQSKIYFDRNDRKDFIFANPYQTYVMSIQNATFYDTKTPYSYLNYNTGGSTFRKEDNIKFLFTQNVNKKFNVGTSLDYLHSIGEYNNQIVDRFAGSLFGSYNGKHYSATAFISTNSLKGQESGGLADPTSVFSSLARKDLATNISGQSNFKQSQFFYNHQYTIGIERPFHVDKDSVRMDYVPITRFAHTLRLDNYSKRYFENAVERTFYANTYLAGNQTRDTTSLQNVTNNVSITLEEEFNKLLNFGLTAFVENEIQRYTYLNDSTPILKLASNTKIGGVLSKDQGKIFKYNVLAELDVMGPKLGDFLIEGNVGGFFKLWNDSIALIANGFTRSDEPSFYYQYYSSNHFRWTNNFSKIFRTNVGGTFSIPTRRFSFNVGIENITNLVYFGNNATPAQYGGNIQLVSARLNQNFKLGKFGLENTVISQISSQKSILPLPMVSLYHNLYYHDLWFKVLTTQFGVNVRYYTDYYAHAYMPATGQFYTQSSTKIGNYPLLNAYLNFHLKRTRFFFEYYNVGEFFLKSAYLSMPNYPLNPAILKMGLSWNFYD